MVRQELSPEVVAAITAAVGVMLDTSPERVRVTGIRPLADGAAGWPSLWGLAGRQGLMNARQALLSAGRKEFRNR